MRGPITLLRSSIDIFLSNLWLFLGIYGVSIISSIFIGILIGSVHMLNLSPLMSYIMSILFSIVIILIAILMGIAVTIAVIDPILTIRQAYERAIPFFFPYILLSIVVSMITAIGLLLLLVPGIIFFVWFAFSYYVLIIERTGIIEAMKRSKELVSGKWWAVFGRLAALFGTLFLINVVLKIVIGLSNSAITELVLSILSIPASAVLVPVSVAYIYLLYKDLKQSEPAAEIFNITNSENPQQI